MKLRRDGERKTMNISHRFRSFLRSKYICPMCGNKDFPDWKDKDGVEYCRCGYWRKLKKSPK